MKQKMKLKNHQFSIRPQIFEDGNYEHPWYTQLRKPNPPTKQQKRSAKFRDKTYYPPVRHRDNTSKRRED